MDGGDPAGGSSELAELIDKFGEHIVSDLRRYYGVNLSDVLVEESGLSPRLVIAYIRNLPIDSATAAALRGGDQFRGWDTQTYLLAAVVDAVNQNTFAFVSANSKKKPKAPEPIERPEQKTKTNPLASKFAAMARIARKSAIKRK